MSGPADVPSTNAPPALIARRIVDWGGDEVRAILFYGSRRSHAVRDPTSRYDFFVLTRDALGFHRALRSAGRLSRPPWLMAALTRILSPAGVPLQDGDWAAKCAVMPMALFERETSDRRHDFFCAARMCQPMDLLFTADPAARARVEAGLRRVRVHSWSWVRPWLPPRFDAETYCRTLLQVSRAFEIRAEPAVRAEQLFQSQRAELVALYRSVLEALASLGEVRDVGGAWAPARPLSAAGRRRVRAALAWSLVRTTARWPKHVLSFDGWLEYLLQKVRRHTGQEIVLGPLERRLPLVFLWPRVVRYLRDKDRIVHP